MILADLTLPSEQELVWKWVQSPACLGFFAAPPCGTASQPRQFKLRLPDGSVLPAPRPLRSEDRPDGLPFLPEEDRQRVSAANKLYHFLTCLALSCHSRDLIVCIENPRHSLYCRTSFFAPLLNVLEFTGHQACAYGSESPKWTALAHNRQAFRSINRSCPGASPSHAHQPRGLLNGSRRCATHEETAYPCPWHTPLLSLLPVRHKT